MPPDLIPNAIAIATFLGAAITAWWQITAKLHAFIEAQNKLSQACADTTEKVDKLKAQFAYSTRRLADEMAALKHEVSGLTVMLHEREKDISRLEGALEQISGMVVKPWRVSEPS